MRHGIMQLKSGVHGTRSAWPFLIVIKNRSREFMVLSFLWLR